MEKEKSTIDLLDFFAGQALSGYIREGLSLMNRDEECKDVAEACYTMAFAFVKVRQDILDERDLQRLQNTTK